MVCPRIFLQDSKECCEIFVVKKRQRVWQDWWPCSTVIAGWQFLSFTQNWKLWEGMNWAQAYLMKWNEWKHKQALLSFSRSVVSASLWPHGLQHTSLPCPSPSSGACSNSCPLSQWCSPTISSSIIPFSSCLQSFPASGFSLMSRFFTLGGQSIAVLVSA